MLRRGPAVVLALGMAVSTWAGPTPPAAAAEGTELVLLLQVGDPRTLVRQGGFELVVRNVGSAASQGEVTVTVPGTVLEAPGWDCALLTCTTQLSAPIAGALPTIRARTAAPLGEPFERRDDHPLRATVQGGGDRVPHTVEVTTPPVPGPVPDLAVQVTADGWSTTPGPAEFLVRVANLGSAPAGAALDLDTLDTGAVALVAETAGWSCPRPDECLSEQLAPGEELPPLRLRVTPYAGATPDALALVARLTGPDLIVGNDSDRAQVPRTYGPQADLVLATSADPTGGAHLAVLANLGTAAAPGPITLGLLWASTTEAASGLGWSCTTSACTWPGPVPAGVTLPGVRVPYAAAPQSEAVVQLSGNGSTSGRSRQPTTPGTGLSVRLSGAAPTTMGTAASVQVDVSNPQATTATAPVVVTVGDDQAKGRLRALPVSASGLGWTCASAVLIPGEPPPSVATCSHPGPLAPGASLPALTATAQTAGTDSNQFRRIEWFASDDQSPGTLPTTATTGLGGGSGDLRPEVVPAGLLRAGQDYTDVVIVHNVGSTPAVGPTTIATEWRMRQGSGQGWDCANWVCTHPGVVLPGQALPPLALTGSAPAIEGGTGPSFDTSMALTNAGDSSREDHDWTSATRPLGLPVVNLSLSVRPAGPFAVEGTVPVEVVVANHGRAADSGGATVGTSTYYDIVAGTGQGWTCTSPTAFGGGTCAYGPPVPPGGTASPLTLQVRTRSTVLANPAYPLDLLAYVFHPQDDYLDDSRVRLRWPLVRSTARVSAFSAPDTSHGVTATFDRPTSGVSAAVVALANDADQPVPATLVCAPGPCGAGPVTSVRLTPAGHLEPGTGLRPVVAPPITQDLVVGPRYRVGRVVQDRQATQAWATVADSRALGGRYARERTVNAAYTGTFHGTGVRYWFVAGPDHGLVRVLVDGRLVATIDQWARTRTGRLSRAVTGLAPGAHRIQVVVTGTRRAASTGTYASVDGLSPITSSCATGCEAPGAYTWRATTSAVATDRVVVAAAAAWSTLSQRFVGTGVDVRYVRAPSAGSFVVYVDGRRIGVASGRAATGLARFRAAGLAAGTHVLQVVAVGDGPVAVDRLEVL